MNSSRLATIVLQKSGKCVDFLVSLSLTLDNLTKFLLASLNRYLPVFKVNNTDISTASIDIALVLNSWEQSFIFCVSLFFLALNYFHECLQQRQKPSPIRQTKVNPKNIIYP